MKIVILAGGYGTRMAEYTKTIPKPMININNTPILMKIISHISILLNILKKISKK